MSLVILGHRGGRGHGWPPENTLAAFSRARDEGADGIELDVRLSADGVPVVFHDETLTRMTGGADTRRVRDVLYADLPALEGGEPIPGLEQVIEAMRGCIVNVEIKSDVAPSSIFADVPSRLRLVRAAADVVARAGAAPAHVVYSSFDPLAVVALAALAPRVPRAILVGTRTARAASALPLALRRVVVAAHLDEALATASRVERLRRSGLRIAAWTVNDPARAAALVARGVRWLITDRPGALRAALPTLTPRT